MIGLSIPITGSNNLFYLFCLGFNGPVFTSSGSLGKFLDMPIKFITSCKQINAFPVHIGTGGFFLFVTEIESKLNWVIGTHIDDKEKIKMKNQETAAIGYLPPLHGWLYLDDGQWKTDNTLTTVSIPTEGIQNYYKDILLNIS